MDSPSRCHTLAVTAALATAALWAPLLSAEEIAPEGKVLAPKAISKKTHPAAAIREQFLFWKYKAKRKPPRVAETSAQAKIIGGIPAPAGAYPWMVALATKGNPDLYDAQFCGAALIHPYWVITAAHCMEDETVDGFEVVLGAHDLTTPVGVQRIAVAEIITNPDYQSSTLDGDLALLRLASPAPSQFTPLPIIDDPALAAPGVLARLLGWGDTSGSGTFPTTLRQVDVPIVSLAVANATTAYSGRLTDLMLPAGFAQGGKDSCQGDSGGPLVVPAPGIPGGWMLAGLISFGEGCAEPNAYGINTRLTAFRNFILRHLYPSYAVWESIHGVLGESRNDDGDRLNNFGEFSFLSNPLVGDSPGQSIIFHEAGGQSYPAVRFRKPAASREVSYGIETAGGLESWLASSLDGKLVDLAPIPGDPFAVLATAPSPQSVADPTGFLRLTARPSGAYVSGVRDVSCPGRAEGSLTSLDEPHPNFPNRFTKTFRLTNPTAGEPLRVTGRSGDFDVLLELLSAVDGSIVVTAASDGAGGSNGRDELINLTPVAGRNYLVRLSSESDGATGAYQLGVYKPADYTALPAVQVPSTTNSSLLATSPFDPFWLPEEYRFRDFRLVGSAGMLITASMNSTSLDSTLEIVNAETGSLLASDDDSGDGLNSLLNFTPIAGVSYIIRATTAVPRQTGSFTLQLAAADPPSPATPIGVPASVQGSLVLSDDRDPNYPGSFKDDYLVTGVNAGRIVTVTMASNQFDCYLFLVNAVTGAILGFDDDGGGGTNSRFTFSVQAGVSYLIRATSYEDNAIGLYTLVTSG